MSVDSFGSRLRSEIHEEGLDQLLCEVRHTIYPYPTSILGIQTLDKLLELFRFSNARAISTATTRQPWESPASGANSNYDDSDGYSAVPHRLKTPHPKIKPPIIELASYPSAQGKTSLLYYMTTLSVLPRQYGGNENSVVWLDSDGRFSALRLFETMLHHLANTSPALSLTECETLARMSLNHIHVFKPQSSLQLIANLKDLTRYLLDTEHHQSGGRCLGLLILDSVTTFYWQDRFEGEMVRLEADDTSEVAGAGKVVSRTADTISQLEALQRELDCAVLFTTTTTSPTSTATSSTRPSAKTTNANPNIPSRPPDQSSTPVNPWSNFATLTLTISRTPAPQFSPRTTLDECIRDQRARLGVVRKGRFTVCVDWSGSSRWTSAEKDAKGRLEGRGLWGFRVVERGVEID